MKENNSTFIKICGITTLRDAKAAVELGADALGFVFEETSLRYITATEVNSIVAQLPEHIITIGVFVNAPVIKINQLMSEADLDWVQLHGDEPFEFCQQLDYPIIKQFLPRQLIAQPELLTKFSNAKILIDPGKSSGQRFDWKLLANQKGSFIVAGGLNSENVGDLIFNYHPYGVDVSSGVENEPGKKSYGLMKNFVAAVRQAEHRMSNLI